MFHQAKYFCIASALLLSFAFACKEQAPPPPPEPVKPAVKPAPVKAIEPATEEKTGVVRSGLTSLKETAEPKGKWMATLMRGEKVTVVDGTEGEFLKIKLSDGSTGFVSSKAVLVGDIEEVLVIEDKPLYSRPDAASLRKGTVTLGTLLFVVGEKENWLEVQLPKGNTGWMKSDDVDRDADELAAARSVFRYDLLKDSKQKARKDQAKQILAEALEAYPDSKVLKAAGLTADGQPAEVAEEEKPAEDNPAEEKPAEAKPAEAKPAEEKPAEAKPAEPAKEKPAEAKPAKAPEKAEAKPAANP